MTTHNEAGDAIPIDCRFPEDRIADPQMPDGRPLSGWKAELEFARQDRENLAKMKKHVEDEFVALRLIRYCIERDPLTLDFTFHVQRHAAIVNSDYDMAKHPEKYVKDYDRLT